MTITPRRGFSVAHGGIDTLIEEEERSMTSQCNSSEDEDDVRPQPVVTSSSDFGAKQTTLNAQTANRSDILKLNS